MSGWSSRPRPRSASPAACESAKPPRASWPDVVTTRSGPVTPPVSRVTRAKPCCASATQEARVLGMSAARGYLEAYDAQLRCDAETRGATTVARLGPLYLATFGS